MKVLHPGNVVKFEYTNHRGVTEERHVEVIGLDFGSNEWYPEDQWFMRGRCLDRDAIRSFALAKIDGHTVGFSAR